MPELRTAQDFREAPTRTIAAAGARFAYREQESPDSGHGVASQNTRVLVHAARDFRRRWRRSAPSPIARHEKENAP
jgi:hypothetical protein